MNKIIMAKYMTKGEFTAHQAKLRGENWKLGFVNPGLELGLRNYKNWKDWFTYGEWDRGPKTVTAWVAADNQKGYDFLVEEGFIPVATE